MSHRVYNDFRSRDSDDYVLCFAYSDPYEKPGVRDWDQMLHRTLSEIFRHLTSGQIEQLLRAPIKCANKVNGNSIFDLILDREPALDKVLLNRSELSLLWIAVLSSLQDSAELLVRSGADVNERYGLDNWPEVLPDKATILHALLQMYPSAWNERFFGIVIDHGADLEARDSDDPDGCSDTALHLAVDSYRVKEVQILLDRGADVNASRIDSFTALLAAACGKEAEEMLPLLMKYGADVKVRDAEGRNALHYLASVSEGHADLARVLIEKGVSLHDRISSDHLQPLHLAAFWGNNELVKLFLDHGANVNARTGADESPLELAAQACEPAVMLTLLKRGANIDLKRIAGNTALHSACESACVEGMKILLSVGADMFAEDCSGGTAFGTICREHTMEIFPTRPMLKTLALRKACLQPSMEFKDERIIEEKYPEHWNYYQACIEEINRTRSTRFVATCTIFELLAKCQCQIAPLMRYREFARKFRLCDLGFFPMYAEDIVEAFERAKRCYESMLDQEDVISEAINNILPCIIVREIARYAVNCEICELKEIVRASRGAPKST